MRIAYWTTASLEPDIEAVSREVFDLAGHFRDSMVFGVSPHLRLRAGRRPRHFGAHPSLDPLLRLAIPAIERTTRINHVYAETSPWLYFKTLRRRPTVLTIASEKGEVNAEFLDRVDAITVQTDAMHRRLSAVERWRCKLSLLYPGVDLKRFNATARRPGAFGGTKPRILFATFPRSREEIGPRGVDLLIDLAKGNPAVQFDLLTRPWARGDTASAAVRARLRSEGGANIRLLEGRRERMEDVYREYDFTVIPYTRADGGKECPLSLVEGMACGIPALISSVAPFSEFVDRNRCGVTFAPDPASFALAIDAALSRYEELRAGAIDSARRHFDRESLFRRFERLYDAIESPGSMSAIGDRVV